MPDIPEPLSPFDTPPIITVADMHQHWRRLMGELGFGQRCLWLAVLDDRNRIQPVIPQIEDVPEVPCTATLRTFVRGLSEALGCPASGWSVGFLLSRHDPPGVSASDLAYADVLTAAAAAAGLPIRPTFVATSAAVHLLDLPEAA